MDCLYMHNDLGGNDEEGARIEGMEMLVDYNPLEYKNSQNIC